MTHPAIPACLIAPYSSKPSQRGGTLIAEDVDEFEEHRRRMADPDGYRPPGCFHCGSTRLHAHGYRLRHLLFGEREMWEEIRRYLCPSCRGVWQVLPTFLCRHLHRSWEVVQSAAAAEGAVDAAVGDRRRKIPAPTVRRWQSRLLLSARVLLQVLAGAGAAVADVIGHVGLDCTRGELVDALAAAGVVQGPRKLEEVAGWIHRLVPGVRLM